MLKPVLVTLVVFVVLFGVFVHLALHNTNKSDPSMKSLTREHSDPFTNHNLRPKNIGDDWYKDDRQ